MDFQFYLPVNLSFGEGRVETVGVEAAKYGKRALLVTGKNSTRKTGLLDKVKALLEKAGVDCVVFAQVSANPTSDIMEEGVRLLTEQHCDVVVALGGGSIIDCAKAIAFAAKNEGEIFEYIFGKRTGTKALPLIAVPTTCGTGSEGNCFAVLTDPKTRDKKSLRNMVSIPKVSIIDPTLMVTMPKSVAGSVMFDALCHNMEAFLSNGTQPIVEMQALYAIELLGQYMKKAYDDVRDGEAWSKVTLASTLGGMNINMAGVTAPHGMEHPASGLRDIVHGRGLAALTPIIYQKSLETAPAKFDKISRLLGGKDRRELVPRIQELLEALEVKTTLSQEGIKEVDVDWMTDNCAKVSAPAMAAHPQHFTKEEIREIYLEAL